MTSKIELINKMQGNGTGWNWLLGTDRQCLEDNWKFVECMDDDGKWFLMGDHSTHPNDIFRISPDYKPEPVTRWFFETTGGMVKMFKGETSNILEINGWEGGAGAGLSLQRMSVHTDYIEVQESDLPYLEKPEITAEMKGKGDDWVFKVPDIGDTFMACHGEIDECRIDYNNEHQDPYKGHRWTKVVTNVPVVVDTPKVCTKPDVVEASPNFDERLIAIISKISTLNSDLNALRVEMRHGE